MKALTHRSLSRTSRPAPDDFMLVGSALKWPAQMINDGKLLASAGYRGDSTVKLWDPTTGELLHAMTSHTDEVTSVSFTSDGRRLASCGYDGRVLVWDTATGTELINLGDNVSVFSCVRFSPDGKTLAAGKRGGQVLIWPSLEGTVQPEDPALWMIQGRILERSDRDNEAHEFFRRGIELASGAARRR